MILLSFLIVETPAGRPKAALAWSQLLTFANKTVNQKWENGERGIDAPLTLLCRKEYRRSFVRKQIRPLRRGIIEEWHEIKAIKNTLFVYLHRFAGLTGNSEVSLDSKIKTVRQLDWQTV